jgi:carboxyl-terminal processing protease
MLEDLIEVAKDEKYYSLAQKEFETLQARLEPQLDKDLVGFKDEIKSLLRHEIVSRYYYQKGAIRSSLGDDTVIQRAIDELGSPMGYTGYFEPGIIITMKRP